MTKPPIAILASLDKVHEAATLAKELGLEIVPDVEAGKKYAFLLVIHADYIGLQNPNEKKFAPFYLDFLAGKMLHRSQKASRSNELIARAIGVKPQDNVRIVDATAGLGRDSFILATLGYDIIMLERSEILFLLLKNAIDRAMQNPDILTTLKRMHLIHSDAIVWLKHQPHPNIVYLDPMFPTRQKTALVKKEMIMLQNLLGSESGDTNELFNTALACATQRVVVKRPRLAPPINEQVPDFSLRGKSSRFDVYLRTGKRD